MAVDLLRNLSQSGTTETRKWGKIHSLEVASQYLRLPYTASTSSTGNKQLL
nr:unnamed protein product [Callosobruchus analis]